MEERIEHESFGIIGFSRVNGCADFFGGELTQQNFIRMTVKRAVMVRDETNDCYFANKDNILKIRMTVNQFSEMITNMNFNDGVPCTIEGINNQKVGEYKKTESKKDYTHRKFGERMRNFTKHLQKDKKDVFELVDKKTLSKTDQQNIIQKLNYIYTEIESTIPFMLKEFQDGMDRTVLDGKTELEAALLHKIMIAGISALKNENNLLE